MKSYPALALALAAAISANSRAADVTWDGESLVNSNWSTPSNWNPDGAPATDGSASLIFDGLIQTGAVNDFAAATPFSNLSFATTAGAFTLSGNSIGLSGNITDSTAALTQSINLNAALSSANHTVHVASTGTLAIGGILSGIGASVTKTGFGTLALSAANTYTGSTTVRNGTLLLNFANPAAPTAQILYSGVGSGRNLTLGKTLLDAQSDNRIIGYAALVATGSGAGTATPVSQTFDSTTFGLGVTRVSATKGTDLGSTTTVDFGAVSHTLPGTTYFLLPSKSVGSISRTSLADPGIFITPALTVTAGTVRTTSTNSNGTTGAANGILGGWAYIADTLTGLPSGNAAGSFDVPANSGILPATELASVDGGGNIVPFTGYTSLGPLNGTGSNLKITSNANSVIDFKVIYSDARPTAQMLANTVASGQITVQFAPGTDTSQIQVGQFFSHQGLISSFGANSGLLWSSVVGIDSPTQIRLQPFNTGATNTNTGPLPWSVYANNVQQLEMAAAGVTDINSIRIGESTGRSIRIGTGNTLRLAKSGAIFKAGFAVGLTNTLIGTQTALAPGTGIQDNGALTAGGPDVGGVAQPGELILNLDNSLTGSGVLHIDAKITDNPGNDNDPNAGGPNGAVTLVKSGALPLILRGNNTYSGGTYILEGRVQLAGAETKLGDQVTNGTANPGGFGTGPLYILPGAQWFSSGLGNGVQFTNNIFLAGAGTFNEQIGAIRLGAADYMGTMTLIGDATLGGLNSQAKLIGRITGPFALTLGGFTVSHEFVLANPNPNGTAGSNDWTGNTTMNSRVDNNGAGLYHLGASEQIPSGAGFGNLQMNNTASGTALTTFDMNGFNETVNGLTSLGSKPAQIIIENRRNNTTSSLTVGDNDASSTFDGTIRDNPGGGSGKVRLTKIGTGTQTLGGADTYTGTTTINAGTLLINGTHAGAGNYTVGPNGTLGGTGSISFASGAGLTVNGILAPGASIESLDVGGNVAFGAASTLLIELDGSSNLIDLLGVLGDITVTNGAIAQFLVTGTPTASQYIFGNYTGVLTGLFSSSSVPAGYSLVQGGGVLSLVQVPEPAAFMLGVLGFAGAAWIIRRRKKQQ